MLPKIPTKECNKEHMAYQAFTRQILKQKSSQNNINNLKLLKQFLDTEDSPEGI